MPDNTQQQRMGGAARFFGGLLDSMIPGHAFDTHASSFGGGWLNGDYARAKRGDPAARNRLLVAYGSKLLGPAGPAVNMIYDKVSRNGLPNFMRGGGDMGPPTAEQQFGYNTPGLPNAGPPTALHQYLQNEARNSQNNMNAALGGSSGSSGPGGWMGPASSFSNGGGSGFGWSGTSNVGGTLDAMSFFGNLGSGMDDPGYHNMRYAVK